MKTILAVLLLFTASAQAQITYGYSATAQRYDVDQLGTLSGMDTSIATNCVAWWTFSQNDGTKVYDAASTHDMTGVASPVWTNGWGGGMVFNGSSQYLTNAAWAVPVSNYTWAIWMKNTTGLSTTNGNTYRAFLGSYLNSGVRDQIYYYKNDGTLYYSSVPFNNVCSVTTNIAAQTWLHIVVSRTSSNFFMFINGIFRASAVTNISQQTGNRKTYIGQEGAGSYMDMIVGDAQIFNRGLTSNEVVTLYSNTKTNYPGAP